MTIVMQKNVITFSAPERTSPITFENPMMCTPVLSSSYLPRSASSSLATANVSSGSFVSGSISNRLAITIAPLNESVTSRPM